MKGGFKLFFVPSSFPPVINNTHSAQSSLAGAVLAFSVFLDASLDLFSLDSLFFSLFDSAFFESLPLLPDLP